MGVSSCVCVAAGDCTGIHHLHNTTLTGMPIVAGGAYVALGVKANFINLDNHLHHIISKLVDIIDMVLQKVYLFVTSL